MLALAGDRGLEAAEQTIAMLNETRHAYGRSALCLSGGASRGVYHLGIIKALYDLKILPKVVSGSSAGSLLAAKLGVTRDEDIPDMFDPYKLSLKFFSEESTVLDEDDNSTVFAKILQAVIPILPKKISAPLVLIRKAINRSARTGAFLDVTTLMQCAKDNIGDMTFQEAYDYTGRIVNITISSTMKHAGSDKPRILNYLTSPNVVVWTAAVASCAIPGVFEPVQLLAKDQNGKIVPLYQDTKWSDGSIENDLPMQRLAELFNVNQFIVGQVNPHATLFSGHLEGKSRLALFLQFLKQSVKNYVDNIGKLGFSSYLKPLGWGLVPLITQKYEGDRTIVPPMTPHDLAQLLVNPDVDRVNYCVKAGERATWPHATWLKNSLLIEITLDDAIKELRKTLRTTRVNVKHSDSANAIARIQSFVPSRSRLNLSDMDVNAPGLPRTEKSPVKHSKKAPSSH